MLIVMALLGMLMLLGMLYFTFASQEQANATYFAEAAKHIDDPGDDIDAIFDAALRQLIQGANYDEKNSALWGGRHSLIFNMLGHDLQPFNGTGVNVYRQSSGQLVVDQDRNGVADAASKDDRDAADSSGRIPIISMCHATARTSQRKSDDS